MLKSSFSKSYLKLILQVKNFKNLKRMLTICIAFIELATRNDNSILIALIVFSCQNGYDCYNKKSNISLNLSVDISIS